MFGISASASALESLGYLKTVSHRVIESNVCELKHDSNQSYAYLTVNVFGDYLSD